MQVSISTSFFSTACFPSITSTLGTNIDSQSVQLGEPRRKAMWFTQLSFFQQEIQKSVSHVPYKLHHLISSVYLSLLLIRRNISVWQIFYFHWVKVSISDMSNIITVHMKGDKPVWQYWREMQTVSNSYLDCKTLIIFKPSWFSCPLSTPFCQCCIFKIYLQASKQPGANSKMARECGFQLLYYLGDSWAGMMWFGTDFKW